MTALLTSLRTFATVGQAVGRLLGLSTPGASDSAELETLRRQATESRSAGALDEARRLYRRILDHHHHDVGALRALRELAVQQGAWAEALERQQRLFAAASAAERGGEAEWLAIIHYELGCADRAGGRLAEAAGHFRSALRAQRDFLPAVVALGETLEAAGDHREAVRAWERATQHTVAAVVLERLARAYHGEGRPSRMIALHREAADRAPEDVGLMTALGRVYLDLEMLDEAADQFEKAEARAPDLPVVHAYLGAIFERRGQTREALEEYHRALRLLGGFEWPQRCSACLVQVQGWRERCPQCGRWNALRAAMP